MRIFTFMRPLYSLNCLRSGNETNVIPSEAKAEFDIRLLPGTEPDEVVANIKARLADENIKVEAIKKARASESALDTQDFAIINDVHLEHFPDALTVASLLFGASDSRFFRAKGIPCYGVCPMLINMGELNRVHGIDERISEVNMILGTRVFTDIVKRLCQV
ncbi:hypothetical protein D1AOALGA4SA_8111 [Olavius algarvensis Delta 1 endosymbiont]|nr:hypothetical protein D1AOALGA4SA_8111 [Olavius algarvensis Delta 1 endosymbiont]